MNYSDLIELPHRRDISIWNLYFEWVLPIFCFRRLIEYNNNNLRNNLILNSKRNYCKFIFFITDSKKIIQRLTMLPASTDILGSNTLRWCGNRNFGFTSNEFYQPNLTFNVVSNRDNGRLWCNVLTSFIYHRNFFIMRRCSISIYYPNKGQKVGIIFENVFWRRTGLPQQTTFYGFQTVESDKGYQEYIVARTTKLFVYFGIVNGSYDYGITKPNAPSKNKIYTNLLYQFCHTKNSWR